MTSLLLVLAFGQLSKNEHQEDGGNAGHDDGRDYALRRIGHPVTVP